MFTPLFFVTMHSGGYACYPQGLLLSYLPTWQGLEGGTQKFQVTNSVDIFLLSRKILTELQLGTAFSNVEIVAEFS